MAEYPLERETSAAPHTRRPPERPVARASYVEMQIRRLRALELAATWARDKDVSAREVVATATEFLAFLNQETTNGQDNQD